MMVSFRMAVSAIMLEIKTIGRNNLNQNEMKQKVAEAALEYIEPDTIIGVGTGSTANMFVDVLAGMKDQIRGAVASSEVTANRLQSHGIKVLDLNDVSETLGVYVDGADEFDPDKNLTKGGGGALTREKIVVSASAKFVCIVDESKKVDILGAFPLPLEIIPMSRALIARKIEKLGGRPILRDDFITDNGNEIIDIHDLRISDPKELEKDLNQMPGVVTNGLFAQHAADIILMGTPDGVVCFD